MCQLCVRQMSIMCPIAVRQHLPCSINRCQEENLTETLRSVAAELDAATHRHEKCRLATGRRLCNDSIFQRTTLTSSPRAVNLSW